MNIFVSEFRLSVCYQKGIKLLFKACGYQHTLTSSSRGTPAQCNSIQTET